MSWVSRVTTGIFWQNYFYINFTCNVTPGGFQQLQKNLETLTAIGVPEGIRTHVLKIMNLKATSFVKFNEYTLSYILLNVQDFVTLVKVNEVTSIYT